MRGEPSVAVVICTFNRCADLPAALDSVLQQHDAPPYEVVVVDNNSTDETRAVVASRLAQHPHLRYVFEPMQGLPYARNTGIAATTSPIVAFTDDDIVVAPDWVASIARAFERFPQADMIGGKVIPKWPASGLPRWFTSLQLAPLAVQDKGPVPLVVSRVNAAPCLIGANFAFRRSAFEKAGVFDPVFTRSQDREIQLRLWKSDGVGVYVPDVVTHVDVPADRLTRRYFRHWYGRAGSFHSRMRLLDVIDTGGRLVEPPAPERCVLGVPRFLYRQLAVELGRMAVWCLRRDAVLGFYHENRVRYLGSYIWERWWRPPVNRPAPTAGLAAQVDTQPARAHSASSANVAAEPAVMKMGTSQ